MQELPNVGGVKKPEQKSSLVGNNLDQVKYVIAISSGKGGVGKSTVAVNLAATLSTLGYKVGLMDADVYGPSVPKMIGNFEKPQDQNGKMIPIFAHGIHFMSIGLLTNATSAVIWRGPMASKLIQTFLTQVVWGELDFLLIDLPPGTGDVQLTLTQTAPLTGAVVVTTPQEVAIGVAMRGIKMFDEVRVPILGLVENMSGFVCGHCHEVTPIFSSGGAERAALATGIPFLGKIPLDPSVTVSGDQGLPLAKASGKSAARGAIETIAQNLIKEVQKVEKAQSETTVSITEIDEKGGSIFIRWSDGETSNLNPKMVRFHCACAGCVDENTGKRLIDEKNISADIHAKGFRPIGRYGIQITWSDGHATGIYTFARLRELTHVNG